MTTAALTGPKSVRSLLETVCSRNEPAEVHCEHDDDALVGRLRLLQLQSDLLCTDRPHFAIGSTTLARHQHVVIYFVNNGVRYMFRSRVARPRLYVALNADTRVAGMGLQIPSRILTQQRRSAFRVSVASKYLIVSFQPMDVSGEAQGEAFEGRITNVSSGGIGAVVEQQYWNSFALGQKFIIQFELPGVDDPFTFDVELRNFRKLTANPSYLIGVRFRPPADPRHRADIDRINHFVAAEERRQLRARK
jgi:c-di-GMP-binding flagellar brake protein YcgR